MPPHAFAYRRAPGIPPTLSIREPSVSFGHGNSSEQYRLIEDDDVAAYLRDYEKGGTPVFRFIEADDLGEVLDTTDSAIEAVKSGEYDDVLDLLVFAERQAFGNRVTVIDAIADRQRTIEEERAAESDDHEDILNPEDVAPN